MILLGLKIFASCLEKLQKQSKLYELKKNTKSHKDLNTYRLSMFHLDCSNRLLLFPILKMKFLRFPIIIKKTLRKLKIFPQTCSLRANLILKLNQSLQVNRLLRYVSMQFFLCLFFLMFTLN